MTTKLANSTIIGFVFSTVFGALGLLRLIQQNFRTDIMTVVLILLALAPWVRYFAKSFHGPLGIAIEYIDDKEVKQPADLVASGEMATTILREETIGREDYLQPLGPAADADPNVAVVTLVGEIERRLTSLGAALGLPTTGRSSSQLLDDLSTQNRIDGETASGLNKLIALRNQVVHGVNVTTEAGTWVLSRAPRILGLLDSLIHQSKRRETSAVPSAATVKILSIDGGGIRGIIPALILAELEKKLGKELHEVFDLIAGTSTGGIIALAIGTRSKGGGAYHPGELADMYVQNGPAIFHKSFLTPLRQLLRPRYSPVPLESVLEEVFAETMFSTALTPLLVSSYDIQAELPFFFKSHKILGASEYDWRVRDIARAISATPTLFPPARLVKGDRAYILVDGSMFTHAMTAFAEASRLYPTATGYVVVSVGTGTRQHGYHYHKARKWGLLGWAGIIVPVFMDSVSMAADYALASNPSCHYYRLQPASFGPASNNMDDARPGNLANLQAVAQRYVNSLEGDNLLSMLSRVL